MADTTEAADLESGYSDETPTATPAVVAPEKVEAPAAPVAPAEEAAPPDPLKEVLARLDKFDATQAKLAGHIGGLQRSQTEIQNTLAASKAATKTVEDAPSQTQVQQAMDNTKEWEELKLEYPEWASATEKLLDHRLATQKAPPAFDPAAVEKIVNERMTGKQAEFVSDALRAVFPDWEDDVKSDAFLAWQRAQPDWLPEAETPEAQAAALADPHSPLSRLIKDKPRSVVALSLSPHIGDAARLLRLFYSQPKAAEPAPPPQKDVSTRQKRLEAAVTPRGTGGHASGGTSEIDEMEAGYSG